MVDEPRILRLLRGVTDDLAILRGRVADGAASLIDDRDRLDAVKYTLVTALEGCIKSAQHIAASEGWGPPATNADAFRVLADHGVIDAKLADRMAAAAGFRNLLIHGYAEIDDERVVANLDSLPDLDAYVDVVIGWLRDA